MNEIVNSTTLVNINYVICENFCDWTRKINPGANVKKILTYNAMSILQVLSCTWSHFYDFFTSLDERMKTSSKLRAKITHLQKSHDGKRTKLQGELLNLCSQIRSL